MARRAYAMLMKKLAMLSALAAASFATPAAAEVKPANALSFLSSHIAEVSASPDDLWKRLVTPKDWWSKDHSWSGSVDGMSIDAKVGGCFCELIQKKDDKGKLQTTGNVEHMRVIYTDPGKVLRMQGALGPLQSESVLGTLTIAIQALPGKKRSKISFNYMVGGHTRFPSSKMASAVDGVLAEQFSRLLKPYAADIVLPGLPPSESPPPLGPDGKAGGLKFDLKDIEKKAAEEKARDGEQQSEESNPRA
jgi:hypothetical protein